MTRHLRLLVLSLVLLPVLAVAGALGYASFGIRITPATILGSNAYRHAATTVPWATRLLSFRQTDGTISRGVEVDKPGAVATVLYLPGAGFTLDRYGSMVSQAFAGIPVNVVVYDRRGFGRTAGVPDLDAAASDAWALYRHTLASSGLPVIIHGHSLGTFVASRLAARHSVPWLVLEAPGTTPAAFVRIHLPWWLAPIARIHVEGALAAANNLVDLKRASARVVLIAGTMDTVLPEVFAKTLASHLPPARVSLVVCRGGDHDDMGIKGCFRPAYKRILASLGAHATPDMVAQALPRAP